MFVDTVYTIEEVAQHLRVPVEVVREEIRLGRLIALNIGGYARVREGDLGKYKNDVSHIPIDTATAPNETSDGFLQLHAASDFNYKWPNGKHEDYSDVHEGVSTYGGKTYSVKLGFTLREAAGKKRLRGLVLIDRYPTVEFVGEGADLGKGEMMASVIKTRDGKHLPLGAPLPIEYQGISIARYRDVVDGPGASSGMAVVCKSDDFATMVKHALIRCGYRAERG